MRRLPLHTCARSRGISQADLGKLAETSGDIIGRYERNEVKPSIDVVIRIADALEVSLDYLVGRSDLLLDKTIIKRIQDIEKLPDTDKDHIFYVIDNLIKAAKLKSL